MITLYEVKEWLRLDLDSNYEDNTVYFLLSGFKVVDYISEDAISQFLGDFHDLKMDESANFG